MTGVNFHPFVMLEPALEHVRILTDSAEATVNKAPTFAT